MSQEKNIGVWSAKTDSTGTKPTITVNGTFKTNGEKPLFQLRRAEPQGINPSELLLILVFGTLADPQGTVDVSVTYSEIIPTVDTFSTVLVVDDKGKTIAGFPVTA